MSGRPRNRLIPDVTGVKPEWLENAELSFSTKNRDIAGLSLFFVDFEALCEYVRIAALPEAILKQEAALRKKFDLVPAHWIKVQYRGQNHVSYSQYFHINPAIGYPITTLRLFLKTYGCRETEDMEAVLKDALEDETSRWGIALKWQQDQFFPRIFCKISRALLPGILDQFNRHHFISRKTADAYMVWDRQLGADDHVYVSIDFSLKRFSSVDFEHVRSESLQHCYNDMFFQGDFRYCKIRIPEDGVGPEFSFYAPYAAVMAGLSGISGNSPEITPAPFSPPGRAVP
ncbi:MAG: hypothetical protein ACQERN_07385 [Thermodesulfobacteriota bacterium]